MLLVQGDPGASVPLARAAAAVADELGEPTLQMTAQSTLGSALAWSGLDIDEGVEHKKQALAVAEKIGNRRAVLRFSSTLFTVVMLHPELRRTEPPRMADDIVARFGGDATLDRAIPWNWLGYAFLESGEWDRTELVLQRWERLHVEGFNLTGLRHVRACLRWMQGRLQEAAAEIAAAADEPDLAPRWYHDVFNLQADVAADLGDLPQVRASAQRYLATVVAPAEESMKAGVLSPIVRAEVAAALRSTGDAREQHVREARAVDRRLQELVARYPHPTGGTFQLETAATHMLLSEAELSRLDRPDPELWERLADQAAYAYWKAYAMMGRAEALRAINPRKGAGALRAARERATALGATHLLRRLDALS
jgi:hypothetical protein